MSTRNLNKKKTIIISIAAAAITICIAAAAVMLTSRSSAEEVETTTETETISETEAYTIKPIPHTAKKQEEPKEITEITQKTETHEPETITFAPEASPEENIIIDDDSVSMLEEYGEYTNGDFEYSTEKEIIETLDIEYNQTTEAPTATTAATTTVPPEEIDWSGIVEDDGVLGGNETGHKPGDGGVGEIGDPQPELGGAIGC